MFYLLDWTMVEEIDILHKSYSGDFTCYAGKIAVGLLCIVAYHHKVVVKLRKYGFDSFSESFINPGRRSPILLIQPIRDVQSDIAHLEETLLNLDAEIAFVAMHHTIVIFSLHIFKVMEVVDTCRCHAIGMYDTAYSADCVNHISVIVQPSRCAIAPVRGGIDIVSPHDAAFCSRILTSFDRLGVNAEYIFGAVCYRSNVLSDFLGKTCPQLPAGVELSATGEVWQIILAFIVQPMKVYHKRI